MEHVKFINLDRHWSEVKSQVLDLADQNLSRGICQRGDITTDVEKRLEFVTDRQFAVTFGCGTDALAQGLRCLNLPAGSEVLVPAYTFLATVSAVSLAGLKPVFVDVDDFYHIDLTDAENKITSNTRVLLYVTLLGSPAVVGTDVWCSERNLLLVEDAAQSFGASLANSVFSIFSFSPSKPCTTFGSGGALLTNNAKIAELAELGRLHGKRKNSDSTYNLGINSVMSTVEASALYVNLDYIEKHIARRRDIVNNYIGEIADKFEFPKYRKDCTYSKFVIQCNRRSDLAEHLTCNGIQTQVHYRVLPVEEPIYNQLVPEKCKQLKQSSITLPNCSYMTDAEVEKVIECLKEF